MFQCCIAQLVGVSVSVAMLHEKHESFSNKNFHENEKKSATLDDKMDEWRASCSLKVSAGVNGIVNSISFHFHVMQLIDDSAISSLLHNFPTTLSDKHR